MVQVNLHGNIGQELGETWNLDVSSVAEAFRAIEANTQKLTKFFIKQAENNAKYEILINNRQTWVPNAENLPLKNEDVKKEHFSMVAQSELFMNFGRELKTIDIVPILEGAGGGGGGGGGGGCFPSGTNILTPNGNIKIENIKPGMLVYGFDHNSEKIKIAKVQSINSHSWKEVGKRSPLIKIIHEKGEIVLTANHWVFVEEGGKYGEDLKYIEAGELKLGDYITDFTGNKNKIINIERLGEYENVYNFEVEEIHNYIANNVKVHNGGGGGKGGGGKGGGSAVKGVFAIFLGILLIGVGAAGLFGLTLAMLAPAILGLVALGVSMLLMKPPPMVSPQQIANPSADFEGSPEGGGGEPSYMFGGPVNTVGEGGPIPLGYGRLIIGSHQVFSSYDQLYRLQSRENAYESDGKPPLGAGAGEENYPTKSYYFNHYGYPINLIDIQGNPMSQNALGAGGS